MTRGEQLVIGYLTVPGRDAPAKVIGFFDGPACVGIELEPINIPATPAVSRGIRSALGHFWNEAREGRVHVYDVVEQRATEALPLPRSKTVGMILPMDGAK